MRKAVHLRFCIISVQFQYSPGGLKLRTGSGGNLIYKCCQTVSEKVTLKWLRCVLYLNVCKILSLKPSCWLGSI